MDTPADRIGITLAIIGGDAAGRADLERMAVLRIETRCSGVMLETAKTTSLVFIILLGAAMLTAAFRAFGGEELVREFLTRCRAGSGPSSSS
jgi:TRAP-type mannitol/chloroaromatic compound transport system permease large subunit